MLRSTKFFVLSSSLASIAILAGTLCLTQPQSAAASSVGGSAGLTGIDVTSMDKSTTPAGDFFQYANGTWLKNTAIPNAYDKWGVLNIIHDKNLELVKGILEKASNDKTAAAGSNQKKIGDFFFIGMDEEKANKADVAPITDELKRIDDIKNLDELRVEVARLHEQGVNALFGFSSGQDFKDSTQVIGQAGQAGLGLPDRDYYTNDDEHSKKLREQYVEHVGKMLSLLGLEQTDASSKAKKIMAIETALAQDSMKNTDMRDPDKVYHKMTLTQVDELMPNFSMSKYLKALDTDCKDINVGQPDFFKALNKQLSNVSLADWKTYLKWHLIDKASPYLSSRFVDQDFAFIKILTGKKENLPRWKRVVAASDRAMGEAVGQAYVDVTFTPDAKAKALSLVKQIKSVLRDDLSQLDWMSKETRSNAIAKLDALGMKIGYPDKWRDYGSLEIDRQSYWKNVANAEKFDLHRQLDKIGKPVDKDEWLMTPQTVNAYYWAEQNEIVFPAGILQPPIFDPKADDATNLGAMGMIIGHELTHGFDDQGSKFDGNGNLKNWWSAEDEKRFKERVALIEKQYEAYTVNGDIHLKGKLVAGEAAADLGGLTIAYKTLEKILGDKPREKDKNGFTPEQRFFISFAQAWATNVRPEKERLMAATDPHPTPRLRVNGTLANMDAFEQTFPTTGAQAVMMLPTTDRCRLW
ncbi:MAG: M13 family metallopeptidase [Candidatus Obscuribacterales bacterium]|nr:M13 family metallopeptidase [Candidatus Obscuribacterales bacterium]